MHLQRILLLRFVMIYDLLPIPLPLSSTAYAQKEQDRATVFIQNLAKIHAKFHDITKQTHKK